MSMVTQRSRTVQAAELGSNGTSLPALVLASSSPRRRELIALTGLSVEVRAADADETPRPNESGGELTRRLARLKAQAVGTQRLVLAADTTVVDGDELVGKPGDATEAVAMLARLRGRRHEVVTSIAVRAPDGAVVVDTCTSSVPMRSYTDQEIERTVASGDPFDKAGGYNIQDRTFDPVDRGAFRDCFANVMGLPLCHVVRSLRRLGIEPDGDVAAACMAHLDYDCPVSADILGERV